MEQLPNETYLQYLLRLDREKICTLCAKNEQRIIRPANEGVEEIRGHCWPCITKITGDVPRDHSNQKDSETTQEN